MPINTAHTRPPMPLLALTRRVLRHLTVERSYERYYSVAGWDRSYQEGYLLDTNDQDARYGALLALLQRHDRGQPIVDLGCGEGVLEEKYRKLSLTPMVGVTIPRRPSTSRSPSRYPRATSSVRIIAGFRCRNLAG